MSMVTDDIERERRKQVRIFGAEEHDDAHTQNDWTSLIVLYLAKAGRDIDRSRPGGDPPFSRATFRRRMIQIAALAIAAAECVDRGGVMDAFQRGRPGN